MRVSALPTFRKHWGRIESGLDAGEYQFIIDNSYDVSKFSGKKFIVLTTTNAFGGKHYVLGGLLIGVGCLSVALCIIFLVGYRMKQSKDRTAYISPNQS